MTTDDLPILAYHHPDNPRLSIAHITADRQQYRQQEIKLKKQPDTDLVTEQESVGGETRYLIYTARSPESVMPAFETVADVNDWLDAHFDDEDVPLLLAVAEIFDGIRQEKEEQGASVQFYKQMELEKLPAVLDRVEWGRPVPAVAADLLSAFVLAHPMPKANHRTGLGLLDRYLTSVDSTFAMPDADVSDSWYDVASEYIYDSKRLIILRRTTPVLRWAARHGYERVRRKEGIEVDLADIDFDRQDQFERYTEKHATRSRELVDALLEEAGASHLADRVDDGRAAFEQRFRGA